MRNYVGSFIAFLASLLLAYASFGGQSSEIVPLMPALKSNWLIIHVVTCFLAYASFALGLRGGAALFFRCPVPPKPRLKPQKDSSSALPEMDDLIYRAIMIGFFLLTLGILTGAVWAESAWGRYWSWDPKETWSLITWLIYAGLLHARLARGWQGKRIAVLAVVGFLAVLFTYFGVSFLLPRSPRLLDLKRHKLRYRLALWQIKWDLENSTFLPTHFPQIPDLPHFMHQMPPGNIHSGL